MSDEHSDIPVIGRLDAAGIGLLQERAPSEGDQRLEDWIASNLDAQADDPRGNHWNSLIGNLPTCPGRAASRRGPGDARVEGAGPAEWSRFHLAYRRGITVVRLLDQNLIQQAHIEELGRDLMDLIAVGNHRVVLNFTAVERLGSWIIGAVGNAWRACAAADGGRLKLCGLDPPLAEIFQIVGMARDLEFHPGEAEAIDSPWPRPVAPRALPVDILGVLLALGEPPPIRGGAPTGAGEIERRAAQSRASFSLLVQGTAGEARLVRVPATGLVIGRDAQCPFRIGSAQVSKRHATIEPRGGRAYLRDLGSTNGTIVNGQTLRGQDRELRDGDTIQIGPVRCTFVAGPGEGGEPSAAGDLPDTIAVGGPADPAPPAPPDAPTLQDLPAFDGDGQEHRIRHEVLEDVLIVTPQFEHLSGEETLAALRDRLQALFESDLPRRVVVNLEFVSHLSRQAIALLLSHHIRLDWAGGGLRICQAHARIVALLDQVRLTMLVDCYPTLDEAVLASWTRPRASAAP